MYEAARESWGAEIAGTLMEMLPPGGWAEVATRSDVAAVKSDVSVLGRELRAQMSELRSDLHVEMATFQTTLERGLRTNTMWTITTMIALVAVVTAIPGFTR